METIGWIGSTLLGICGLPEAWRAFRYKKSDLSWWFIGLWGLGELLVLIPILFKIKESYLIFNYSLNLFFICVIVKYKRRKR